MTTFKFFKPNGECRRATFSSVPELATLNEIVDGLVDGPRQLTYVDSEGDRVLIKTSHDVTEAVRDARLCGSNKSIKISIGQQTSTANRTTTASCSLGKGSRAARVPSQNRRWEWSTQCTAAPAARSPFHVYHQYRRSYPRSYSPHWQRVHFLPSVSCLDSASEESKEVHDILEWLFQGFGVTADATDEASSNDNTRDHKKKDAKETQGKGGSEIKKDSTTHDKIDDQGRVKSDKQNDKQSASVVGTGTPSESPSERFEAQPSTATASASAPTAPPLTSATDITTEKESEALLSSSKSTADEPVPEPVAEDNKEVLAHPEHPPSPPSPARPAEENGFSTTPLVLKDNDDQLEPPLVETSFTLVDKKDAAEESIEKVDEADKQKESDDDDDGVAAKVKLLRDMGFGIPADTARKMIVEMNGRMDLIVRALVANSK